MSETLDASPAAASAGGETAEGGAAQGLAAIGEQSAPWRRRRSAGMPRLQKAGLGLIIPILVLGGWQLVVSMKVFPTALIPGPMQVLRTLENWAGLRDRPKMFYSGNLWTDIAATAKRVLVGFALAAVVGVLVGTAIGVSRTVEHLVTPTMRVLGPIPPITWIPVVIVVLGISERSNYALTFIGSVFPIVASTAVAVSAVGRDLLRAGRMIGHSRAGVVWHVVLPAALPGIVGGLRIGLGLSWMMAVTSEMLAVHSGLGYTLWNAYNYLDYPAVFAAMIVTGLCGLATDALLLTVARPATRWHAETGVRS